MTIERTELVPLDLQPEVAGQRVVLGQLVQQHPAAQKRTITGPSFSQRFAPSSALLTRRVQHQLQA
jgi:hypothetical protein